MMIDVFAFIGAIVPAREALFSYSKPDVEQPSRDA